MLDHVDPKSLNASPSINWKLLEQNSAKYAAGATELSTRLAAIESSLASLPGRFSLECETEWGEKIGFRRQESDWILCIRRGDYGWMRLANMNVLEKATLAGGLPNLLREMNEQASERADAVANGLAKLTEAESLLGNLEVEGE